MEVRLMKIETNTQEIFRRLDKMERIQDEIQKLTISVNDLAQSIKHICNDVGANTNRLTCLEEKPSKRWDNLVGAIIAATVSGLMGVIIGKLL